MTTPEAAFGRLPLKGAASAAWPSQLRDARLFGATKFGPETPTS
jgi:hypothetical protein